MTNYLGLLPPELRALTAEYLLASSASSLWVAGEQLSRDEWCVLWDQVYWSHRVVEWLRRTPFSAGR